MTEHHDRDELVELMSRYANVPDTQNWDELPRSVFCDEFTGDFSSVGAPVTTFSRDAWCQRTKPMFAGWTATHHAITNHRIAHRRGSCDHLGPRPRRALGSPRGRGRWTELLAGRRLLRQRRRANSRGLAAELGEADPDPSGERGAARGLGGGGDGLTSPHARGVARGDDQGSGAYDAWILISMSTPAGRSRRWSDSTVLLVGSMLLRPLLQRSLLALHLRVGASRNPSWRQLQGRKPKPFHSRSPRSGAEDGIKRQDEDSDFKAGERSPT